MSSIPYENYTETSPATVRHVFYARTAKDGGEILDNAVQNGAINPWLTYLPYDEVWRASYYTNGEETKDE